MDEDFDFFVNREEHSELIERCERMLRQNTELYFDVYQFSELLDYYIETGKLNKAFKLAQIALRQHPSNSELEFKKAKIHIERNDGDSALSILKHLYKIESNNPDILYLLGVAYSMKEDFDKAIAAFNAFVVIEDENDKDDNFYHVAISFLHNNQYSYALLFLKKAYALNPKNMLVVYDLAFCYEKLGKASKSISFYTRYLNYDPYSETAWYNLGVMYSQKKKYYKAIEAFDYAIAIDDGLASAYFNKGNCLAEVHRHLDAIEAYSVYLSLDPGAVMAHVYIAESYEKSDDFEQAEMHYSQAIEIQSECAEAWYGLGVVKCAQLDIQTAIQCIQKAIEIEPLYSKFWLTYGIMLREFSLVEEAVVAIQKSLNLQNDDVDACLQLAEIFYTDLNDYASSVSLLTSMWELTKDSRVAFVIAAYAANKNDMEQAVLFFKKAYATNPDTATVFFETCVLDVSQLHEIKSIMY